MRMLLILFCFVLFPYMAQAEECSYEIADTVDQNFTQPLNDISKFNILAAAKDCLLSVLNGAWDSTGGVAESAWNCLSHPIDCAESSVKAVKNAYHFLTNLSSEMNKVWTSLKAMKGPQIAELICGIVGAVGADILVGILTAGAASGKLGLTIAKIVLKIKKYAGILGHVVGMPLKILQELKDDVLDYLGAILKRGDREQFLLHLKGAGCVL